MVYSTYKCDLCGYTKTSEDDQPMRESSREFQDVYVGATYIGGENFDREQIKATATWCRKCVEKVDFNSIIKRGEKA